MKSIFIQQILSGSSFVSPASGWVGQGRLKNIMPVRRKNLRAKPKQAGKKEGGWGEGIFAHLLLSGGMAEGGFGLCPSARRAR